jgi:hypothetical protein
VVDESANVFVVEKDIDAAEVALEHDPRSDESSS